GRVIDEDRCVREPARGFRESWPVLIPHASGSCSLCVDPRLRRKEALCELLRAHLERENDDPHRLLGMQCSITGERERKGGLSHGRPRRNDDQIRTLPTTGHIVQLAEATRDAGNSALSTMDVLQSLKRLLQYVVH